VSNIDDNDLDAYLFYEDAKPIFNYIGFLVNRY